MCALICAVRFSRRITQGGGCWLLCADNGTDYGGGAAQGVPDTQRKNSGNQAGTASRVKTASLEEEGETRPATAKKSCPVDPFHRHRRFLDDLLGFLGAGTAFHALPRADRAGLHLELLGEAGDADLVDVVGKSHA